MIKKIITAMLVIVGVNTHAQNKIIVHGFVYDKTSKEPLVGANVKIQNQSNGATSNAYGYFSVSIAFENQSIIVSYIGFKTDTFQTNATHSIQVALSPEDNSITEVKVTGKNKVSDLDVTRIPLKTILKMPAFMGETDIFKSIQMLPGVQAGVEGTSGFNVRGGTPDQNLTLLDGVPVYNVNHLFGFFSTFNSDAISSVDFYKNTLPARYGGRLSSVVDVRMKEGNASKSVINVAWSPLAGRFLLETPLYKDKSSLMVSYRRTWLDLPLRLVKLFDANTPDFGYFFHDLNIKSNVTINSKNRIYFSYYYGNDDFHFNQNLSSNNSSYNQSKYGYHWGNSTYALRWNRTFGPRIFMNSTFGFSRFKYGNELSTTKGLKKDVDYTNYSLNTSSGIEDVFLKSDLNILLKDNHKIETGVGFTKHNFIPENKITQTTGLGTKPIDYIRSTEVASEVSIYAEDKIHLNEQYTLSLGVRNDFFSLKNKTFNSFQPRISIKKQFKDGMECQVGYGKTAQFHHLLVNSSLSFPTDLWLPSTDDLPIETAHMFSLGFQKPVLKKYHLGVEMYWKSMYNLLDYKEFYEKNNFSTSDWNNRLTTGKGTSYGIETMLQKNFGKLQGWLSYTLSWSNRIFSEINDGKEFPFKYDRRHYLTTAITYDFVKSTKKKKTLSANFLLSSGNLMTLGLNKFQFQSPDGVSMMVNDLSEKNNFRVPFSHRLDISYQATKFQKNGKARIWTLGLYNAYNQRNPNFVTENKGELQRVSILPILPSISYQKIF